MKLSEISADDEIIVEKILDNKELWEIYIEGINKEDIEGLNKEYGENFKLYKLEYRDIELDAREMVRGYMKKIQTNIKKKTDVIYNVNESIANYVTEQEYSILDYILKNLLSRIDDNFYKIKGEEIEVDI